MTDKKNPHYIDNKEFLKHMIEYKKSQSRESYNFIGECFMKIANRLAFRPNFINYTFKEDMISDGIENCVQYCTNFDPNKSKNPFAFFTQIIYFAFLRRIGKEKKQSYIKMKSIEHAGFLDPDALDVVPYHTKEYINQARYDIHDYEEKMRIKKEADSAKRKQKALKGLENFMEDKSDA